MTSAPTRWDLARYFARLGTTGFGGPIALVGAMQRDLVEGSHWFSESEYSEGLALAQLAPGPLAAQLAIYLGWVRGGVAGATLSGVAFVAPSFAMVLALSAAYVRFGGLPWMRGVFYGVSAAVIAVIARSAVTLARNSARHDALLWTLLVVNAVATLLARRELVLLVVASGFTVVVVRSPALRRSRATALSFVAWVPAWLLAGAVESASWRASWRLFGFFATAGSLVFGSGLAIIPFLYGGVVQDHHWLTESQFLDAIAVAMITPGPVVITVAFIGYLVDGTAGAIAAALGVFLPVYVTVVVIAPWFRRALAHASVKLFVAGVTAAAVGAIAGAVVVLGERTITDWPAALICLGSMALLVAVKRLPTPALIAAAGAVGVLLAHWRLVPAST